MVEKEDSMRRVTKVTLELIDGTTETYDIRENDGIACFMVSAEQDLCRVVGYCEKLAVALTLIDEMLESVESLESSIRFGRWVEARKN